MLSFLTFHACSLYITLCKLSCQIKDLWSIMDVVYITIEGWIWGALNYTYVIFEAGSSEVQFLILQGSAGPEVKSELYEELKARI